MQYKILPGHLYPKDNRVNLYYLHNLFKVIGESVAQQMKQQHKISIPITAGMWGGSYMVGLDDGQAKTPVARLYSIVNLPQNSPLNKVENFECLMEIYQQTICTTFKRYGLNLVDPRWGEIIPYSNNERPTTALQMWDTTGKASFVRAFFVWNEATWEESIIYDMIRNIKVLKELLNINTVPPKKDSSELKFLLQDVLITYFTLYAALTPDFVEHAEPIIKDLFSQFMEGMHSEEAIEEQYRKVYSNALVYGFEEALKVPYGKEGLNIKAVEDWPVEKINYVPDELKEKLIPALQAPWKKFHTNLEKEYGEEVANR
ncbi:MAG: hypothetical protein HOI59_11175 [Nitrospina sp.]|jgi:hypothetical protein|nr:hypothetical protein [Nitrospina sp.]MBT3413727.1 hypothetical protein [Nitrospina sp.]MBT3857386.1 hypothetical protein [Nitrospina sp.]MBT4105399.1 hypothetical protein [Nitrospina sp.]MBT4389597.1 hypothetical protein [Nitrospina sp.]